MRVALFTEGGYPYAHGQGAVRGRGRRLADRFVTGPAPRRASVGTRAPVPAGQAARSRLSEPAAE